MKKYFLIAFAFAFFSCDSTVNLPYEFNDTLLEGRINDVEWVLDNATARQSLFSADTLSFQMSNELIGEPCDYLISDRGIRFTVPANVGLFLLSSRSIQYQSVEIYEGGEVYAALAGAIEILSIDTLNNSIEGQIDATYNGSNYVNGKFTATYCHE